MSIRNLMKLGMPLSIVFALLVSDLGWSLKERAVQELVKFELRSFDLNNAHFNFLIGGLPSLLGLTLGMWFGDWCDRKQLRFKGKAFLICVISMALTVSVVGLGFSKELSQLILRLLPYSFTQAYSPAFVCVVLFWVAYEIFTIILGPLYLNLIASAVPSNAFGRFFAIYRIISLLVGATYFGFFFTDRNLLQLDTSLMIIATVFGISFLLMYLSIRNLLSDPVDAEPSRNVGLPRSIGDYKVFLFLFIVLGVCNASSLPVNVNAMNAYYDLGGNSMNYGSAIAITYVASILLAYPIGIVVDSFDPRKVATVLILGYACCMGGAFFFAEQAAQLRWFFIAHGVLSGSYITATAGILPMLLPIDKFNKLAAMAGGVTSFFFLVASGMTGWILDRFTGIQNLFFLTGAVFAAIGAILWMRLLRSTRHDNV